MQQGDAFAVVMCAMHGARRAQRNGHCWVGYWDMPRVAIPETENVQTERTDEIQRLRDEFNTALQQMLHDHAEECGQLNNALPICVSKSPSCKRPRPFLMRCYKPNWEQNLPIWTD